MSETTDPLGILAEPPSLGQLRRQLLPFCHKYPIARLEVFGSVADGTATLTSDVDLMVTFDPGVRVGKEFFALVLEFGFIQFLTGRRGSKLRGHDQVSPVYVYPTRRGQRRIGVCPLVY